MWPLETQWATILTAFWLSLLAAKCDQRVPLAPAARLLFGIRVRSTDQLNCRSPRPLKSTATRKGRKRVDRALDRLTNWPCERSVQSIEAPATDLIARLSPDKVSRASSSSSSLPSLVSLALTAKRRGIFLLQCRQSSGLHTVSRLQCNGSQSQVRRPDSRRHRSRRRRRRSFLACSYKTERNKTMRINKTHPRIQFFRSQTQNKIEHSEVCEICRFC